MFMTFNGAYRGDPHHVSHIHESPPTMLVPLAILAVGAAFSGMFFANMFVGELAPEFWRGSVALHAEHGHHPPDWVILAPFVVSMLGLAVAYYYYIRHPELPPRMAAKNGIVYNFIYNKWYFDELYDFLFVRPAIRLGRILWKGGDGRIIDGLGPDGVAARVLDATKGAVRLQSGYVYHYAFAMLLGVAMLATYFMVWGMG
jgi:NADH-quinone oxidoreductase subunit L